MQLREGKLFIDSTATCAGCGQDINCSQQYLTLQLDNQDGTLQRTDYAFSHFHNEHCVSECIKRSEK